MPVPRHLRYSPVNWLVVQWGHGHEAFNDCGLPQPRPCSEPYTAEQACNPLPIREAINTYDWERWLPEVIVGIEDPDEEIAANYVRESAIEFCRDGRVLQREIIVELQTDETTYPVFPYDGERIVGVIRAARDGRCSPCAGKTQGSIYGLDYRLDTARNEITVAGSCRPGERLRLLVWAAPTEDACEHDEFLYEAFRRDVTIGARMRYVLALHFRDTALLRVLPTQAAWDQAILKAKRAAVNTPSSQQEQPGSGMWQSGCQTRRRGW